MATLQEIAKAADLNSDVRTGVRDLILVLADSKRLLGMRFGNWILGAPELEAGIACASMAQDEWGHARLLYALLRDFGDEVDHLEHGRDAADYAGMAVLDREPQSWPELVALNALADTALTLQLHALGTSAYVPLRQRVQKLIEEETFHAAHGAAWFRRIAGSGANGTQLMKDAAAVVAPGVLQWFGPDSPAAGALVEAGITSATGSALRAQFSERVAPLLATVSASLPTSEPDFSTFDEARRRPAGTKPDDRTIAQIRGDKNRAFLMD
jgi:ring-1,2-phenylacetyl-CoA epoxidase subunit PaaC